MAPVRFPYGSPYLEGYCTSSSGTPSPPPPQADYNMSSNSSPPVNPSPQGQAHPLPRHGISLAHPTQPRPSISQGAPTSRGSDPRPGVRPDFLIVGLFALRLAKQLIQKLGPYPERDRDLNWLDNFLALYPRDCALAKLTDSRMDNYVISYRGIVSRFIKQPRYPIALMGMNPDGNIIDRALTDQECKDIIDFADAASEWGSTIKIPAHEAKRMEDMANTRRRLAE